jgi:hypothetical protein
MLSHRWMTQVMMVVHQTQAVHQVETTFQGPVGIAR